MTTPRLLTALFAGLYLGACSPSASPVKARVLVPDTKDKTKFTLGTATLTTLTDLEHLEGAPAKVLSGVKVSIDTANPPQGTATDIRREILKAEGEPFKMAYAYKDDVVWPEDWHSLNALTTYYNFEQAWKFFHDRLGLIAGRPGQLPIAYWADVTIARQGQPLAPERDNAAFYALLKQFWVYPFDTLQHIPLSMNPGIIAHEYSHAVNNSEMFGGEPIPAIFYSWTIGRSFNVLKAMDEGFADLFAGEATADANFMASSIPEIANARRLDRNICYANVTVNGAALHDYVTSTSPDGYDPYQLGTVIATTLWAAANQITALGEDRTDLFKAVLTAQQSLGETISTETGVSASGDGFDLNLIANAIAAGLASPTAHAKFCSIVLDRWAPITLTGVGVRSCATVTPESNCPH